MIGQTPIYQISNERKRHFLKMERNGMRLSIDDWTRIPCFWLWMNGHWTCNLVFRTHHFIHWITHRKHTRTSFLHASNVFSSWKSNLNSTLFLMSTHLNSLLINQMHSLWLLSSSTKHLRLTSLFGLILWVSSLTM